MRMTLTGINFQYDNGYNEEFTSVSLNFNSSGESLNISGLLNISNEQYKSTSGDVDLLKELIKQEIIIRLEPATL